jgi:hypothetical protein
MAMTGVHDNRPGQEQHVPYYLPTTLRTTTEEHSSHSSAPPTGRPDSRLGFHELFTPILGTAVVAVGPLLVALDAAGVPGDQGEAGVCSSVWSRLNPTLGSTQPDDVDQHELLPGAS